MAGDQARGDPSRRWTKEELDLVFDGPKAFYTIDDLNRFSKVARKAKPPAADPPASPPVGSSASAATVPDDQRPKFLGLRLRNNYDDVLGVEDGSLDGTAKGGVADLKGAQFSYAHDFRAGSNVWAAKGAVIAPFSWRPNGEKVQYSTFQVESLGLTPSVSFQRVQDGKDPSNDVDSLGFRAGGFLRVGGLGPLTSLTARGFFRFDTDFSFRRKTRAAEFELEPDSIPLFLGRRFGFDIPGLPVIRNPDAKPGDPVTNQTISHISGAFRIRLHAEFGQVIDSVALPDSDGATLSVRRSFTILGPKLSLTLDRVFYDRLKLGVDYSHFERLSGRSRTRGMLAISPEFVLNKPAADATAIDKIVLSLKATYQNGFVDENNPRVRALLIGLGVLY